METIRIAKYNQYNRLVLMARIKKKANKSIEKDVETKNSAIEDASAKLRNGSVALISGNCIYIN